MISDCYLIIGELDVGRVYLLFPVIRLSNNPLWYSLCSIEFTPGTMEQIYNETLFNPDATPKESHFFRVSVSGKLKIDKDSLIGPPGFGTPAEFFCFQLDEVTVPQPVQLPFQARWFFFMIMWAPVVIYVLGFFAFLFFIISLGS